MAITAGILEGAIDLHTHSSPDFYPRSISHFELVEIARQEKMAAVVLKNHFCPTYFAAEQVTSVVADIPVLGGVVLNMYVGGLNPYAVDLAVKAGAKIIWMPTLSAENHLRHYGASDFSMQTVKNPLRQMAPGLTICEGTRLNRDVLQILDIIAASNVIIATGHVSGTEALMLVREASSLGIKKILINHPDDKVCNFPRGLQHEMVSYGAIIEHALITTMPGWGKLTIETLAANIRDLEAEHCVLVTDFGQAHHEIPSKGLKSFVTELHMHGITDNEISLMVRENPAWLLGVS